MIKSRRMRWVGGEERCIHFFGGAADGKRPLVRPRHSWEDNIKMDVQEAADVSAWTGLMWLRIGRGGRHL
jgi:hypothetical protein